MDYISTTLKLVAYSIFIEQDITVSIFQLVLNTPIFGFLTWLVFYHAYLVCIGKSTYQHIVERRQKRKWKLEQEKNNAMVRAANDKLKSAER